MSPRRRHGQKRRALINAAGCHVNAPDRAAHPGKGQQVAAFAAAYFQYTGVGREGQIRCDERQVVAPGGGGLFLKILLAQEVSGLHIRKDMVEVGFFFLPYRYAPGGQTA